MDSYMYDGGSQKARLNLPMPLNALVGRESELAEVDKLVSKYRLLTVTGMPGIGKSHLALYVARCVQKNTGVDVRHISFDSVRTSADVAQAIAAEWPEHANTNGQYQGPSCGDCPLLLLDNFEHVVGAGSYLAELLATCPELRIMVTSRESLSIRGEQVFRLGELPLPMDSDIPCVAQLLQNPAVMLFVQRAQAVNPNFALTTENATAVVEICRGLDGIPLAIELVAARVKALTPRQIAARLGDLFHLLIAETRPGISHRQALRASIDWSFNLLDEAEKRLFCELSRFEAEFSIDEVEQLYGDDIGPVLELLCSLVDKSLIVTEEIDGAMRYHYPEPIRQYAKLMMTRRQSGAGQARVEVESRLIPPEAVAEIMAEATAEVSVALHAVATPEVEPDLRVVSLGMSQVFREGRALPSSEWRYARAREMLYFLLCHDACTKDEIGEALWPEVTSTQLRDNFRVTLHHLRKALGGTDWVIYEDRRYRFNREFSYWFDVEQFEEALCIAEQNRGSDSTVERAKIIAMLEKTIALVRGDFLSEVSSEWALVRQEELRRKHIEALLKLGELYFAEGHYARAVHTYRKVIKLDGYLESAHRELMRCYVRMGERTQALRHYQGVVEFFQNELGTLPAPETSELYASLRRGVTV